MRVQSIARVLGVLAVGLWTTSVVVTVDNAPAGFVLRSNGLLDAADFAGALEEFTGPEAITDGLGPVYNAAGCGECHATPIIGGSSQVVERRAGRWNGTSFFDHPGGSLIQDRSIDASVQETVLAGNNVIALRSSLSILGDGFIEAIDSNDIIRHAGNQPTSLRGTVIEVPVLEANGAKRVGRFGWKNQQASLLSFAADAYVNEMGITSPFQMVENSNNGRSIAAFDAFAEPEDLGDSAHPAGADVHEFADFMRATLVPPRGPISFDASEGEKVFNSIGCETCHKNTFVTAPAGTSINGGAFKVPTALAKRFMHDLRSHSLDDAIQRHGGQAASVRSSFNALSTTNKTRVLRFLASL
jgi:CxxC motif-containing protein (DUF1111 family)